MDTRRTVEEFNDCTSKIIGCAMKVHATLGSGLQEVIYQRALELRWSARAFILKEKKKCPFFIGITILGHGGWIFSLKMR